MTETDWTKLPAPIVQSLLDHYTRIECHILLELELAGMKVSDTDFDDLDWSHTYTFGSREQFTRFLDMVWFDEHPSGQRWRLLANTAARRELSQRHNRPSRYRNPPRFSVVIPRLDLHIVHRNLKRLNAIIVDDYDNKKRQAIERTGYVDA